MVAVPIILDAAVVGILEVFSPHPYAFEETDATALRRLSDIIAGIAGEQKNKVEALAKLAASPDSHELIFGKEKSRLPRRTIVVIASGAVVLLIGIVLLVYWLGHRTSSPPPVQPTTPAPASSASQPATTLDSLQLYAAQGDAIAQFALGARFAQGDGVKQDYAEAVRWFTKAAEQGHVVAQATLGAYYWAGRGVQQDLVQAYFWSVLARAGGDEASRYRVAALTSRMTRNQVAAAQQQANEWLRKHQVTDRAAR